MDEPDYKAALVAILNSEHGYSEAWPSGEVVIDGYYNDDDLVKQAIQQLIAEGLVRAEKVNDVPPVVINPIENKRGA